MTAEAIACLLNGKALAGAAIEIEGVYVGDFLSRVMGRAPEGCAWITVMNNLNVAGVAVLAGVGAVVLCEDVAPLPELKDKLEKEGIALITTPFTAYECCKRI